MASSQAYSVRFHERILDLIVFILLELNLKVILLS